MNVSSFVKLKKHRNNGYNKLALFSALLLSLAVYGKLISLRNLENEGSYDIHYQETLNGEQPSYKTFASFINHDLSNSVEQLLKKLNLYIMDKSYICRDILYINGTK